MDPALDLIRTYGVFVYALLFGYCALKSGALPLFAGYIAQLGALDPIPVLLASFAGGYLGDEAPFAIARRYGDRLFDKRPRLRRMLDTARALMDRYGPAYIFLYRYPKGMRTIGALPVGLGQMSWSRFTMLNASSAALWSCLLVAAGYFFGAQIERAVIQGWGNASVILLVAMVALGVFAWWRINRLAAQAHKQADAAA
jgi:membrane-associated protein